MEMAERRLVIFQFAPALPQSRQHGRRSLQNYSCVPQANHGWRNNQIQSFLPPSKRRADQSFRSHLEDLRRKSTRDLAFQCYNLSGCLRSRLLLWGLQRSIEPGHRPPSRGMAGLLRIHRNFFFLAGPGAAGLPCDQRDGGC